MLIRQLHRLFDSKFAMLLLFAMAAPGVAAERRASSAKEVADAARDARPGDEIVLTDGKWKDQKITFAAKGSAEKPITVRAETPGKVVLLGESSLTIDGEHLVVSGLFFG